ncbi:hypothetical protein NQ317_009872 [Molorchus minor]|uniref:PAP-associated domain-containing protein n=1 Tax=Molorchus minor TaxID=1323400 RepID=A0ABQ9K3A5_9CUCU|nr:hypothetical protein NQ317_009872 [Molorchus minor]
MTVSSYSWALMVIHYLQFILNKLKITPSILFQKYTPKFNNILSYLGGVTPPVLPCLHGLVPEKFNSDNENHSMDVQEEVASIKHFKSDNIMCLGELLVGFFQYYSLFNYNQYAVSVRAGCRLPVDECRYTKAPKNDPHQWKYLCIEEPFDFTNTARSVFDMDVFKHIRNVITCSYQELARSKLLKNVLPINLDISQS